MMARLSHAVVLAMSDSLSGGAFASGEAPAPILILNASLPSDPQVKHLRTLSQPGRHDIDTALVLEHNTLLARTRLNGALYSGPDRAYKAVVNLDTVTVCLCTGMSSRGLAVQAALFFVTKAILSRFKYGIWTAVDSICRSVTLVYATKVRAAVP